MFEGRLPTSPPRREPRRSATSVAALIHAPATRAAVAACANASSTRRERAADGRAFSRSVGGLRVDATLAWLLEPADPAVRAKALVDLVGRSSDDREVLDARDASVAHGSVARLLAQLRGEGDASALYLPKYDSGWHQLIALAEMGAPGDEPRVARALEACLTAFAKPEGGFGRRASHLCTTGNIVRAATLLGRGDDARVRRGAEWLVSQQQADGGWSCWPDEEPRGSLDAWEALGAFAAMPADERPRKTVERGVEFLLSRKLGAEEDYAPWRRAHFPRHYYYDLLVGLELATTLGDPRDERLKPALAWLASKRAPDGTWRHERHHPDFDDPDYSPYAPGLGLPIRPLVVEPEGEPSKWVTLAALRVLRRVGVATPAR